jgi:hypothetical protein
MTAIVASSSSMARRYLSDKFIETNEKKENIRQPHRQGSGNGIRQ